MKTTLKHNIDMFIVGLFLNPHYNKWKKQYDAQTGTLQRQKILNAIKAMPADVKRSIVYPDTNEDFMLATYTIRDAAGTVSTTFDSANFYATIRGNGRNPDLPRKYSSSVAQEEDFAIKIFNLLAEKYAGINR